MEKINYQRETGRVIYTSKMTHGKNRSNFKVFTAREFIAAITQHIPENPFNWCATTDGTPTGKGGSAANGV